MTASRGAGSPRIARRTLLGAALAVPLSASLAACSAADDSPAPVVNADPDVALRDAAIVRESGLLMAYDAALAATPASAARLAPLRAEHAVHLAALQDLASPLPSAPVPTPGPSGTSDTPDTPDTPGTPGTSQAALVQVERAAGKAHASAARTASPALAQVLASLAAAEASHEVALISATPT